MNEDWPPKITITPEGIAARFLLKHAGNCNGGEAIHELVELFKMFYEKGADIEKPV